MATLLQYPIGGTVDPAPLPTVRVSSDATGGQSGAQFQQIGAELQGAAANYTALQNQVRVNDALNQARQTANDLTFDPGVGYQAKRGQAALQPDDNGLGLAQSYSQKLSDNIDQIASTLTPQQQRVFRMSAGDLQTSFQGNVQQHVLQQSQVYGASVYADYLKTATDMVGQVWNQPGAVNGTPNPDTGQPEGGLVNQAKAAAYAAAKLTGTDPNAAIFEAGSHVHAAVLASALENQNPAYAAAYLGQYKSQMTTEDLLRYQGMITQQAAAQTVQSTVATQAEKTLQGAVAPTQFGRLTNLVAQQESGGKDFDANGNPVTSSSGAKYTMQVMPETAANPGHGIAPAASDTPAEYNRVGTQLLGALVQKYGNVPQALAAYNAGEGNVDKAIASATSAGEPDLWFQALGDYQSDENHQQTANYIAAIAPKYQQGAGAAPLPTKEQFVQGVVDALGPNATIPMITAARTSAEARYTLSLQSRDEQGDQAVRAAQQGLVPFIQAGGDFTSWMAQNPSMVNDVVQYAPGKMDDLAKFSAALAKGENHTNLQAYGAAVLHPDELAALPESQFYQLITTQMSHADAEKLINLRNDQLNGQSSTNPNAINQEALTSKLNKALLDVGIDPQAKDAASRTRYGDIQQTIADALVKQQQQQGKKFAAGDIDSFVDQQFSRLATQKHWFTADATVPALSTQWSDAPSDVQQKITAAFAARGIASPTDGQKLRAWLTYKQANPDAAPTSPQQ
jgi:soluble lytic murein transglycosylase